MTFGLQRVRDQTDLLCLCQELAGPFGVRSGVDNSFSGIGRNRADFIGTDINQADLGSDRQELLDEAARFVTEALRCLCGPVAAMRAASAVGLSNALPADDPPAPKPDADGFYALFDGKSLDGWKASENPGVFTNGGGSAMTGETVWAVVGPVVVVAGLAVAAIGLRGRRSGS